MRSSLLQSSRTFTSALVRLGSEPLQDPTRARGSINWPVCSLIQTKDRDLSW